MILFCCASELGLPEDLSAIEVILLLLLLLLYYLTHTTGANERHSHVDFLNLIVD